MAEDPAACGRHAFVERVVHAPVGSGNEDQIILLPQIFPGAVRATAVTNNVFILSSLKGVPDRLDTHFDPADGVETRSDDGNIHLSINLRLKVGTFNDQIPILNIQYGFPRFFKEPKRFNKSTWRSRTESLRN